MFTLDSRLEADSFLVKDFPLCQLRLMNDAQYPWVMLIPRLPHLREMIDLSPPDELRLMGEISQVTRGLKTLTNAHKMNIAALGNVVPQLHVHIIARFPDDVAWPAPVFGKHPMQPYTTTDFLEKLKASL